MRSLLYKLKVAKLFQKAAPTFKNVGSLASVDDAVQIMQLYGQLNPPGIPADLFLHTDAYIGFGGGALRRAKADKYLPGDTDEILPASGKIQGLFSTAAPVGDSPDPDSAFWKVCSDAAVSCFIPIANAEYPLTGPTKSDPDGMTSKKYPVEEMRIFIRKRGFPLPSEIAYPLNR